MNRDLQLLKNLIDNIFPNIEESLVIDNGEDQAINFEHPLDKNVIDKLSKIKSQIQPDNDDYRIFYFADDIKCIWKLVIQKSIKCLRYFDLREPFLKNPSKHPDAYVDELSKYFEKYIQFESLLYGGGKYYRDHIIHVFRVWLLGLECLLDTNAEYLNKINIHQGFKINGYEKISIWSMIALTHDLGYPLEKAQGIIDQTKEMMKSFITNPTVSMNLSFSGVQNDFNNDILQFISSKMVLKESKCPKDPECKCDVRYVARKQHKYLEKYRKSLESYSHGILSAIILYKLLKYFLESDFSLNEDYTFGEEEARQFFIRREILRTISSHTCHDIYHLDMLNFAFLLIVIDDAQEWGRKRISELYVSKDSKYEFVSISPRFNIRTSKIDEHESIDVHSMKIKEKFDLQKESDLKDTLIGLFHQGKDYREIFRDGQDTVRRNFVFLKECDISFIDNDSQPIKLTVNLNISNEKSPVFLVEVSSDKEKNTRKYGEKLLSDVFGKKCVTKTSEEDSGLKIKYEISDVSE